MPLSDLTDPAAFDAAMDDFDRIALRRLGEITCDELGGTRDYFLRALLLGWVAKW